MKIFCCLLLILSSQFVAAQLRLPAFFADHMVLQRGQTVPVWGRAAAGNEVQVEFLGKSYSCIADEQGAWKLWLDPLKGGEQGALSIRSGTEVRILQDVVGGELWICSGQSNMEWRMDMLQDTYAAELRTARNDQLRFAVVGHAMAVAPMPDLELQHNWAPVSPATVGHCSAVAYWFGKKIQEALRVPVGLIVSAWGGTPAEAWTAYEGLSGFPAFQQLYRERILPLDLSNIAQRKKELYQQFTNELQAKAAYVQQALQPGFDDAQWLSMSLPRPWEESGYPALDGVLLFRISFTVSEADAGKPAILQTPGIDDMDSTYINGTFIGTTDGWDQPRRYVIPGGVLKAGVNLLAVRVQDNQGGGGFAAVPDQFYVQTASRQIPLAGSAKFQIIAGLKDLTDGHGAIEHQPSVLYNAMVAPLLPLRFRGVIWYQGESNANTAAQAMQYRELFPALIRSWRSRNGQDFPFLFVQLSSFGPLQPEPGRSNWALLREAQLRTLALPHTGMAVSIDVGDPGDIHPKKKKAVGHRLADEALRMAYGQSGHVSRGPVFRSMQRRGPALVLNFDETGRGLLARGGPLREFSIAGKDHRFYRAEAVIRNRQVIVRCPQVPEPVAVRYAWADSPVGANLYNLEGFPATPFRSDDWED